MVGLGSIEEREQGARVDNESGGHLSALAESGQHLLGVAGDRRAARVQRTARMRTNAADRLPDRLADHLCLRDPTLRGGPLHPHPEILRQVERGLLHGGVWYHRWRLLQVHVLSTGPARAGGLRSTVTNLVGSGIRWGVAVWSRPGDGIGWRCCPGWAIMRRCP